jgi:hypothetical protein
MDVTCRNDIVDDLLQGHIREIEVITNHYDPYGPESYKNSVH